MILIGRFGRRRDYFCEFCCVMCALKGLCGKLISVGTGYRRKKKRLEYGRVRRLCRGLEGIEWTVKSGKC